MRGFDDGEGPQIEMIYGDWLNRLVIEGFEVVEVDAGAVDGHAEFGFGGVSDSGGF